MHYPKRSFNGTGYICISAQNDTKDTNSKKIQRCRDNIFSARALVGRTRNLTNKSLWFRGVASLDLDLKAQAESWARSK